MNLGVFTETRNSSFVSSRQRIQLRILKLKELLAPVRLPGRYDNILITFKDLDPGFLRVIQRGTRDDIYEVDVGYSFSSEYLPEDDVLVIQLLEDKLRQIVAHDSGFQSMEDELLRIISAWTTASIGA